MDGDSGEVPTGRDRYEDRGVLGRGGMSEVRLAFDRYLERTVAMKVLSWWHGDSRRARRRFLKEIWITARLTHPGIISLYDRGAFEDGRPWYTMPVVRGKTLRTVIRELHRDIEGRNWPGTDAPRGWTLRRVVDTLRKLCDAVAYAHRQHEIIHRDLKPANLMVGAFGEVQVMDWGLAKVLGEPVLDPGDPEDSPPLESEFDISSSDADLPVGIFGSETDVNTIYGDIVGTAAYMSPEQARGELDALGPPSDVYCLGACLWTILVDAVPFEGETRNGVLMRLNRGDLPSLEEARRPDGPPVPPELARITAKAMASKPADRYADAGELATELALWLDGARRRQEALAIVEQAEGRAPRVLQLRGEAAALREEAARMVADLPPQAPAERHAPAWALEDRATAIEREAATAEAGYVQLLRSALNTMPTLPEAHDRLAELYKGRVLDAERRRDFDAVARYDALLADHDRGGYARFRQGLAAVSLHTDPPGAMVDVLRYEEIGRRLVPTPVETIGPTPIEAHSLPHGSYLFEIRHRDRPTVCYPVFLERDEHWDGVPPGEREPLPVPLPTRGDLPEDMVYVPPGWCWIGGDPLAIESFPRMRIWIDGFLIGRHPVTAGEYLAYLEALDAEGRSEERAERTPSSRSYGLESWAAEEDEAPLVLGSTASADAWQPKEPIVLVSRVDAFHYARWRAERDGRPVRLPHELEREKAARGADARPFSFGHYFHPSWARIASSASVPAPALVTAYETDQSPYGVRGLTGNTRDLCGNEWTPLPPVEHGGRLAVAKELLTLARHSDPQLVTAGRGGAWQATVDGSRAAGRLASGRHTRSGFVGFRLAQSLTA
ncbi:MAG: bifunctional serine/threonine-protein kinase/formylglycine-generating enzyme family protein [Sandaracinaceae bacterium]